jgi:hypothetical protein
VGFCFEACRGATKATLCGGSLWTAAVFRKRLSYSEMTDARPARTTWLDGLEFTGHAVLDL